MTSWMYDVDSESESESDFKCDASQVELINYSHRAYTLNEQAYNGGLVSSRTVRPATEHSMYSYPGGFGYRPPIYWWTKRNESQS
jgi:hypothetical protein